MDSKLLRAYKYDLTCFIEKIHNRLYEYSENGLQQLENDCQELLTTRYTELEQTYNINQEPNGLKLEVLIDRPLNILKIIQQYLNNKAENINDYKVLFEFLKKLLDTYIIYCSQISNIQYSQKLNSIDNVIVNLFGDNLPIEINKVYEKEFIDNNEIVCNNLEYLLANRTILFPNLEVNNELDTNQKKLTTILLSDIVPLSENEFVATIAPVPADPIVDIDETIPSTESNPIDLIDESIEAQREIPVQELVGLEVLDAEDRQIYGDWQSAVNRTNGFADLPVSKIINGFHINDMANLNNFYSDNDSLIFASPDKPIDAVFVENMNTHEALGWYNYEDVKNVIHRPTENIEMAPIPTEFEVDPANNNIEVNNIETPSLEVNDAPVKGGR